MSDSETAARIKNSQSKSFRKMNPHLFGEAGSNYASHDLNGGGEDDAEHDHIAALTAKRNGCRLVAVKDRPYLESSPSHVECDIHGEDCPSLNPLKLSLIH